MAFKLPIQYLFGNQTTYFLYGLRLYDPTFIPRDWYTWEVFHPSFAFSYLLYCLQKLGPLHITTTMAQLVIMTALSFGLLLLSKKFCKFPIPVFLGLLAWTASIHGKEIGLGWQQLIAGYFQPSEISASFMILGFGLLFMGRYLASGTVLGLAGLFHWALLVSYGPTVLVTALAIGIGRNRKSLLSFGLPLGLLWGINVLVVGNAVLHSAPPTAEVMSIQLNFRNPGDFIISNWPTFFTLNWLMWASIGSLAIFTASSEKNLRELRICFLAALVTVTISVVQFAFVNIPSLTGQMIWRCSPLVLIMGLLVTLDRCLNIAINPEEAQKNDYIFIAGLSIAFIWLAGHGWGHGIQMVWLIGFSLSIGTGLIVRKLRSIMGKRWVMGTITSIMLIGLPFLICYQSEVQILFGRYSALQFICIIVYVLVLMALMFVTIFFNTTVNRLRGYSISSCKATFSILSVIFLVIVVTARISDKGYLRNHFMDPSPPSLAQMEKWVRDNTPENSIILIHPNMEYMRIRARRAVVVDEKSVPQLPSDVKEWYQRICDVCGFPATLPALTPEHIMFEGYRNLDTERTRFLQKKYGSDYVVVLAKEHIGDLSGLKERFRNDDYLVLEIPFTGN